MNNRFGSRPMPMGTSRIAGTVFHDFNRNGVRDLVDVGLGGWVAYLDLDNDRILDTNEQRMLTDSSGNYIFSNLAAGTYKVRMVRVAEYIQTTPTNNFGHTLLLSAGQHATGENFGADN